MIKEIPKSYNCEVRDLWPHPYPGNCVVIGHTVVYYDMAARAFSAGIKYQHCRTQGYCIVDLVSRVFLSYKGHLLISLAASMS